MRRRIHLFEFHDQSWFPADLRNAATAYLETLSRLTRAHDSMVPYVKKALDQTGARQLVDLCSGGTGPVVEIARELGRQGAPSRVLLTDKFPNLERFERAKRQLPGMVEFNSRPVDATAVGPELSGVRTIINAFHHFRPAAARSVLQDAMKARQGIVIAELSERNVPNILSFFFIPLMVLVLMPLIRPVRWSWLLFTYVIPVLPLVIAWDGLVSHLRVYNEAELRELTAGLDERYQWSYSRVRLGSSPAYFSVLTGLPTN